MVDVQYSHIGEVPDWMVGPQATVLAIIVLACAIFWAALHLAAQMKVDRINVWFRQWESTLRSFRATRSGDLLQSEDLEVGLADSVSTSHRKKKPRSVLRRVAKEKCGLGGFLNFFIAEPLDEEVEVEMGPFDLEDGAWLQVRPSEVSLATQHFIGDEETLHCSPRPRDLSIDAFALGDDAWHMRSHEKVDQSSCVL
jgi:hypothetical protein